MATQLSFEINQAIQQEGIKKCFEMGGRLTVQGAFQRYSTTELRKIISRLRKAGMPIADEWKQNGTVRYKEYYLSN
jgi:hypothetical protein